MRHLRAPLLAIGLLGVLSQGSPALAAKPELAFTIRPESGDTNDPRSFAWLLHRADPGAVLRDRVLVENLGSTPVSLELYASDASTTGDGSFSLAPREAKQRGVSRWLSLEHDHVVLDPGETRSVGITIAIPANSIPGDHVGGVVARTTEALADGPVRTLLAVGSRVYLRVNGPIVEDVRIEEVRPMVDEGEVQFALRLRNAGNTAVEVGGGYDVHGLFAGDGEGRLAAPVTLLPGSEATTTIQHSPPLLGGSYDARFDLTYGHDRHARARVSFSVSFAWPFVAAAAAIMLLGAGLLVARRRSRPRA